MTICSMGAELSHVNS